MSRFFKAGVESMTISLWWVVSCDGTMRDWRALLRSLTQSRDTGRRAMSRENVEVVRGIYERGDFDRNPKALMALVAPDIELLNPIDAVETGTRSGIDSVRASLEDMIASFEWMLHEPVAIHDGGDCVVAWVRFRGKGAASGAELEQYEAHTWTFRDGVIVRMEWGRDLAAALEAAGLRE